MGKNVDKNLSQKLRSKYNQKPLDHAKQSATGAHKIASKKAIQKIVWATVDLIGSKIAVRITKVSKTSQQNNLEKNEEEILRERYISPEQKKKSFDDTRLI